MHDTYSSPLSARYASRAMLQLWSAQERHLLWRQLWIALAESEMELGIDIPQSAIAEMRWEMRGTTSIPSRTLGGRG